MTPTPVAVITGGGTGIGAATAAALRGKGWEVIICGRRREAIAKVAETTGAHAVVADVASVSDMERLVADTVDQFGTINGLVLDAGIVRAGSAGELSDEDWNAMVSTNLPGPFLLVRAALPHLIKASGSIVGVASAAALRATAGIAGYDATKAGLAMLMQTIAVDYGPLGVRANAVCPGRTRTEMADMEMGEFAEHSGIDREKAYSLATAFVPSRRPAASSEVADVIAWLLSDQASYINAATIPVDGGLIAVEPGAIAFDPRVSIGTTGADGPTPAMQAIP